MADGTRVYSLLGPDGEQAMASGLAGARWYQTEIPRKQLATLMQRRDGPAIRDTIILFTAMAALGSIGAWLFP
ncbi:MAG: fatty acid desaturase, partial [Candidatus Puniceispirillaceae bacterium]